jgi:hypothetical protein
MGYQRGDYDGTLSPLLKLSQYAHSVDADRRFVIIIDEFDDIAEDLYLQGNLAETFFANLRAITASSNICAGLLSSLIETEGLVELPESATLVEPGTMVAFVPYLGLL